MRAKISRLSKGIFDKDIPELEVSKRIIEGSVSADGVLSGSFLITSHNGQEARGFLHTDTGRIVLKETSFSGKQAQISYEIYSKGLAEGDKLKGSIYIVSDGGELRLPCEVQIEAPCAMTSMGKIRNLFHFTNLVKNHYDEAKRLFLSSGFADIFLSGNPGARAAYEGLRKSSCVDTAMEEFLVSVHKKTRVMLTIGEERQEYPEFKHTQGSSIVIMKSGWGYLPIEAEADGDFLRLGKKAFTSEEFSGSVYRLGYTVEEDGVHAGKNTGRILIRTPYQELSVEIFVEKRRTVKDDTERKRARRELKEGLFKLAEYYFSFRLHKLTTDAWCKKSLKLVERLKNLKEAPLFLELLQLHLLITQKKNKDADFLLHQIENKIWEIKEEQPELYAYYLYVRVLHLRDSRILDETLLTVRRMYENGKDTWQVLWVLLYLDEEYAQNKSLKLVRLKEQYAKGARSPFLYYEACAAVNEQPELVRVLNGFELQAVFWGVRHDALTEKAGVQIAVQCQLEKRGTSVLYRILMALYGKYKNKIILESLLSLLIRDGRKEAEYFRWYEEGVLSQCGLTGLYEAYLDTLPELCTAPIPKLAAMYFAFDTNLSDYAKEKLYENLLRNEQENMSVLPSHMPAIEQFALDQIEKGRISRKLAYIYKKVVTPRLLNESVAGKYPRLLLSSYLYIGNRRGKAVVCHKECGGELAVSIEDGGACVPIYTEDVSLLYEDERGRRFLVITQQQAADGQAELTPLFHEEAMIRNCFEKNRGDVFLWLHVCEKAGLYHIGGEDRIRLYRRMLASPHIRQYYKNQLSQKMIEYYMDHYDGDKLEEQLARLDMTDMEVRERTKLLGLLIARAMYQEAYRELRRYGYEGVSPNRLMKLCIYLLWVSEGEEDAFLLELCAYVFFKGKYDETILNYLLKYYGSTTKNMLKLWQAAVDFSVDTLKLEERLIAQMLFSGGYVEKMIEVFEDYYHKSVNQMLIMAYLAQLSHRYFIYGMEVNGRAFSFIEQEYYQHGKDMPDICKLALLRYYAERESLSEAQVRLAGILLAAFLEENRCFGFYKKLERYMELPPYLRDKTIVEYQSNSEDEAEIHYMLDTGISGKKVYEIRKMERSYAAFYAMEFTLFYGERLKYYISEHGQNGERMMKSDTIFMDHFDTADGESRYHLLNDICACAELKDTATLRELMKSYAEKRKLSEEGFSLL